MSFTIPADKFMSHQAAIVSLTVVSKGSNPTDNGATAMFAMIVLATALAAPFASTAKIVPVPEPDEEDRPSKIGWPGWRGPRRDNVCLEKGLLTSWPREGPRLLWEARNVNGEGCGVGDCVLRVAGARSGSSAS